jgi:hypothetical protein
MHTECYTGRVIRHMFARGSKSEHEAVFIVLDDHEYVLRRADGDNPFADPELDALVGKTITCEGVIQGYVLTITRWEVVPRGEPPAPSS